MSSSLPDPFDALHGNVPAHDARDPRADPSAHTRGQGGPPHATGSKTSGVLIAIVSGAIILVLLLIFILQNSQRVSLQFLVLDGRVPVGVAVLLAAVAGALVVAIAGGARILQLRRRAQSWKR